MRLHKAWVLQAKSDRVAAHVLLAASVDHCQVVAKCQQAVEKAVKGLVEAMWSVGLVKMEVDSKHHVARYVEALIKAAEVAPKQHRFLKGEILRLFPAHTKACIVALDAVVPQYPKPGALAAKNTEYPFQLSATDWSVPKDPNNFSRGDIKRYIATADRVQGGVSKIVSALEITFPNIML